MLAEDAIRAAISDYRTKNPKIPVTDLGAMKATPLEK